jgi:prepilin-type N-terminal cleavage/methylation domain-containing protein
MKSFAKKYSATTAGLTLLESMIALAIFAVVIWAAMANYTTASASQSSSQMATELQSLRASVKDLYSGQGNFGSASATYVAITASLIAANKVPSTLNKDATAGTLKTSTGGAVVIEGNTSDFAISYAGVPKAQCISAVTGAGANGWIDMKVGATTTAAAAAAGVAKFTPASAAAACNSATNGIIFRGA